MGIGDNIVVNDFMFCEEHGREVCHRCCCDHRMCNNNSIEDKIRGIANASGFDIEERYPIDVFALGAVKGPKKDTYQCMSHNRTDCIKCFDWVLLVKQEAGLSESDKQAPLMPLD